MFFKLSKGKIIIFFVVLIAIIIGLYFGFYKKTEAEYDSVLAEYGDLTELISITGRVKPAESVDLAFESAGKVDIVLVEIGDEVKAGDSLIKLVNSDLSSEYSQAVSSVNNEKARLDQLYAALEVEKSRLEELERGSRQEEISVAETKVASAKGSLKNAQTDVKNIEDKAVSDLANLYDAAKDIVINAKINVEDVVNLKTDDFYLSSTIESTELVFNVSDPKVESDTRKARGDVLNIIERLSKLISAFPSNQSEFDLELENVKNDLSIVQNYLFVLNTALIYEADLSDYQKDIFQSKIDTSLDQIQSVRTSVSTQIQLISAQKIANQNSIDTVGARLNTAENTLRLAENELSLIKAKSLPEVIASQEAQINQAKSNIIAQQARIQGAQSQLGIISSKIDKTVLRAPIDGVVIKQEAKIGEIVTSGKIIVSINSKNNYEIKADIPEVDIANVKIDDVANITLDAYSSSEIFKAKVVSIDPAETIIDGVPTYEVTLVFLQEDSRIKSGMTANTDIITNEAKHVVAIPQRAVAYKNGTKQIQRVVGGNVETVIIETGIISWDGLIEVKSGVQAGDDIVTYIKNNK